MDLDGVKNENPVSITRIGKVVFNPYSPTFLMTSQIPFTFHGAILL